MEHSMRVAAVLILVEIFVGAPALAATFSEGRAAYDQNHIADAERIYSEVIADSASSGADRAAAARELARISWLIDGDSKRALTHLRAARQIGDKPCDTAAMTARVLRESRQAAEVIRRGGSLMGACPEPSGVDAIRTHIIGAYLDQANAGFGDRTAMLESARSQAAKYTPDADIEAARVRLEAALLTDDASGALAAWKDYFWLDDSDAPQALANVGATKIFNDALRGGANAEDQLKLAEMLMRTGFATQSERFARSHGLPKGAAGSPIWKKLQAYWSARQKFEAELLSQYRRYARGGKVEAVLKAEAPILEKAAKSTAEDLIAASGETGKPEDVLRRAYGLEGTGVGSTDSYPSIHIGHLVEDRDIGVSQYGKSAKIHFRSIDNMISNSFESWLWDGSAGIGGWAANGVIVQVRPRYTQGPMRAYLQLHEGEARRNLIAREKQHAAEDLAKLKQLPVATLEGLNDRLQLQLIDRVAAVALSKSTDGASFRRAFLAEFSRANFDQSIYKHEGRHSIDEVLGITGKVAQPVLEYQAKLSELALGDYPRMALHNMNRNVEGTGMHDLAVAKLFDEYRKWMEAHTGEIMGYDPSIPVLAQFDKLSDDQIREIARSLDPLPNGKPSPAKL